MKKIFKETWYILLATIIIIFLKFQIKPVQTRSVESLNPDNISDTLKTK